MPGRERPPQSLIDFVTNEVGANHRHPDMARGVGAAAGAGPLPAALAADLDALRAALKGKADHKDLQDLSDKLQRALATKADRQDVRALMDRPAAAPSAPVMGLPGGAGEGAGAGAGAGAGGPNSTLGLGQAAGPLGSPGSGLSGASSVGASGVVGGGDGKGGEGGTQELYKVVSMLLTRPPMTGMSVRELKRIPFFRRAVGDRGVSRMDRQEGRGLEKWENVQTSHAFSSFFPPRGFAFLTVSPPVATKRAGKTLDT